MNQKDIGKAYTATQKFNEISGNLTNIIKDSIALQLDLIQEMYLQSVQAYDDEDPEEFADGVADIFVVVCGMIQKLSASGYDMKGVLERVAENNLSKYPTVGSAVRYDPAHTITVNKKYQVQIIKDTNGKVRKPLDFKPVDLQGCFPSKFFK